MRKTDNLNRLLFTTLSFYLIVLLLRYPTLSLEYASRGLNLWLTKMVPTLLPFMILSGIMIRMELTDSFVRPLHPLLRRVFGTTGNGSYTIIMGFLCGFPMGARIVGELYESGGLSRDDSARLLYFCNNIGPIYFLSYVTPTLGIDRPLIPLLIMYGIPLLYGLALFRVPRLHRGKYHTGSSLSISASGSCENAVNPALSPPLTASPRQAKATMPLLAAIDASVLSGLLGIAKLGGYMIFFNLLNIAFVPFQHVSADLLSLYQCLLEITSGIDQAGQSLFYPILILLPFGGFSCIAQTYSMIRQTDLSVRPYIFHKVIQTAITSLCYLLLYIV